MVGTDFFMGTDTTGTSEMVDGTERVDGMTAIEDLMRAALTADEDRKAVALRALRGEVTVAPEPVETVRATEPFLTQRECARLLGFSACSLWRWQVPEYELGGRPRYRLSEVELYLGSEAFRQRVAELRVLDRERKRKRGKTGRLKR